MTKKDFELIAGVLADVHKKGNKICVVELLADALAETNPRFDRGRFLTACIPV